MGEAEQMGEAIWGGEEGMLPRKLKEAPGRETACSEQLRFLLFFVFFFVREGWEKEGKSSVKSLFGGYDSDTIWTLKLSHCPGLSLAAHIKKKTQGEGNKKTPRNSEYAPLLSPVLETKCIPRAQWAAFLILSSTLSSAALQLQDISFISHGWDVHL